MHTGTETGNEVPGHFYAAGRWRKSAYPIAAFVEAAMAQRSLARGTMVAKLGYRNAAKGLRHLDLLIEGCEVPPEFLRRFVTSMHIDRAELDAALEATRAVQREEARQQRQMELAAARAAFRPYLHALTERTVFNPPSMAGYGRAFWLLARVPGDVVALPIDQQLTAVGEVVRAHYAERKGRAGPFGAITAYLFRTEFEKAIWLDTEGMVQGDYVGEVSDGCAYLTLRR